MNDRGETRGAARPAVWMLLVLAACSSGGTGVATGGAGGAGTGGVAGTAGVAGAGAVIGAGGAASGGSHGGSSGGPGGAGGGSTSDGVGGGGSTGAAGVAGSGGHGGAGGAAAGGRVGQGGSAAGGAATGGHGGAGGGIGTAASCADAPTLMQIVGSDMCPAEISALPATPSSAVVWIASAAAPDGGYRLTLELNATVFAADGHSYGFTAGDTLFGTGLSSGAGPAILGTLALRVDGQRNQITFDFGGCAGPTTAPSSVVARIAIMHGGTSQTVKRTYALTAPGQGVAYKLSSTEAPAGCTTGVDLLGISF